MKKEKSKHIFDTKIEISILKKRPGKSGMKPTVSKNKVN